MNIPVFHDDQHGTAIIVAAAISNALRIVGKDLAEVKLVTSGAGAAALACLNLLVSHGLPAREHLGHRHRRRRVYKGRERADGPLQGLLRPGHRGAHARTTSSTAPTSSSACPRPNVLKPEMVATMADRPLIMALANPDPGDHARRWRARCAATRSSPPAARTIPNQVNNVLCFPFIFRGALDVGATAINEEMKIALVKALADARAGGEPRRSSPRPMATSRPSSAPTT